MDNSTNQTTSPFIDASHSGFFRPSEREAYMENGFVVLKNALDLNEVNELNADAMRICRGEYGDFAGYKGPHDGISDIDLLREYLCIHFPHKISSHILESLAHRAIVEVLTSIIGPDVKCMQSLYFIKSSGKPGQAWHQDEDFIPTRDRSLTGAWIALDDATVSNGCLWVIPGSHKTGVLWPQRQQQDPNFDCTAISYGFPYTDDQAVPVEVEAGSIVLFNGYTLHRSLRNASPEGTYRRALVNHYMSANSLLPWTDNLQSELNSYLSNDSKYVSQVDCRDIVMIAGKDPYGWMGITDVNKTHVRPSREGGCLPAQGS